MEVDKVHNELIEWQRLIEHQRAAITLQETKVETAASTVDAVTHRHDTVESRCRQLEEDVAAKEKTISNLHSRASRASTASPTPPCAAHVGTCADTRTCRCRCATGPLSTAVTHVGWGAALIPRCHVPSARRAERTGAAACGRAPTPPLAEGLRGAGGAGRAAGAPVRGDVGAAQRAHDGGAPVPALPTRPAPTRAFLSRAALEMALGKALGIGHAMLSRVPARPRTDPQARAYIPTLRRSTTSRRSPESRAGCRASSTASRRTTRGEAFLRVHWVAVPKATLARRVDRLVKMLSSTREYAEFVQRAYAQSDVAYVEHGSPLVRTCTDLS
jgi:hypothetical protein